MPPHFPLPELASVCRTPIVPAALNFAEQPSRLRPLWTRYAAEFLRKGHTTPDCMRESCKDALVPMPQANHIDDPAASSPPLDMKGRSPSVPDRLAFEKSAHDLHQRLPGRQRKAVGSANRVIGHRRVE